MVSYERLPMLEVVFDRLVRTMMTSLRNFTSENVEVLLDTLTSVRFGDYLNSITLPAMLAVSNYIVKPFNAETPRSKLVSVLGDFQGRTSSEPRGKRPCTVQRKKSISSRA